MKLPKLITEPSWWCRTVAHRRARELRAYADTQPGRIVVAQLSGNAPEGDEDRTCDRCRVFVPKGPPFWLAWVRVERVLVVGLCTDCARLESPEWVGGAA